MAGGCSFATGGGALTAGGCTLVAGGCGVGTGGAVFATGGCGTGAVLTLVLAGENEVAVVYADSMEYSPHCKTRAHSDRGKFTWVCGWGLRLRSALKEAQVHLAPLRGGKH